MKHLFLPTALILLFSSSLLAQEADPLAGESYTYHDSLTRKKVKEVFHHKQVVKIMPDPVNYGDYIDSVTYVRNGAYMRYYDNGKLEVEGHYKEDKQDGTWTWFDRNGKQVKTEKYSNGKLIK
jgi:hypothetical protein